jgi:hypothetical protein
VCGIGICGNNGAIELWYAGLFELEMRLHPISIIIYGEEREIPGIATPIKFIKPYSNSKFQKNKV